VGIDRPGDGDTPDDAPAGRAGPYAGPLSDPSARMAEQAWYRGTVEKVYAAARDAWAEAVPGLRAAWAKHEQHYPERTRLAPRTQPDGSWVDGGNRELIPSTTPKPPRPARTPGTKAGRSSCPPCGASRQPTPDGGSPG